MTYVPDDLTKLETTTSDVERNALALRLADERAPGLSEVLARLIRRPELDNRRGTLVYSLAKVGASNHVGLLCDLVLQGNWEVAHEALDALAKVRSAEGLEVGSAAAQVRAALAKADMEDWRRELASSLEQAFG